MKRDSDQMKLNCNSKQEVKKLLKLKSFELFNLADKLREELVGEIVTYVINRNINFTNICLAKCKFCAFHSQVGDGFFLSIEEILRKVEEAIKLGATEVCIQGGLYPGMKVEDYCNIIRAIKENYDIHIHAFSPMEVWHAARNSKTSVENTLRILKQNGLDSMPGTAAEILNDRIRREICPRKLKTQEWIAIVKKAHELGIPTTATMMYGHVESIEDRIAHMFLIRKLQQETRGFTEFIPLTFMSKNNPLGKKSPGASGLEDLRVIALARLIFACDLKNIQASWVKLGVKLAQVALHCGANDLGGTLMEENISKSAGAKTGEYLSPQEFVQLIKAAGRVPRQRNTLYELL
ncbi:MAG: 5-amino-6-(D-ribitylamino)uracil--L-tyrosine 4-hydroxyphenyl transferase CofH [Halobacteria archaeon]